MIKRFLTFALCVCFVLGMSIPAFGSTPDVKYIIIISPPAQHTADRPMPVTIRLEDVGGEGFEQAQAKLGEDGAWHDITDSLRQNGWAHFEFTVPPLEVGE
jgi:hypothetical protein